MIKMKRQRNFPLTYFIRIKLISCGGKKKERANCDDDRRWLASELI